VRGTRSRRSPTGCGICRPGTWTTAWNPGPPGSRCSLPRSARCDGRDAAAAERYLDLAVDAASETHDPFGLLELGLFKSFTGVGWAEAHIGRLAGDHPTEPNDFDHLVAELLAAGPWTGPWGLADGLVGLGVYARERIPATGDSLAAISSRIGDALTADSAACPADAPEPAHLGMGRGLAGLVSWLVSVGVPGPLLTVAHHRLTARIGSSSGVVPGSPAAHRSLSPAPPRSGWLDGDTGTAAALVRAAPLLGESAMGVALEATHSVLRLPVPADAHDLSLRHGCGDRPHARTDRGVHRRPGSRAHRARLDHVSARSCESRPAPRPAGAAGRRCRDRAGPARCGHEWSAGMGSRAAAVVSDVIDGNAGGVHTGLNQPSYGPSGMSVLGPWLKRRR